MSPRGDLLEAPTDAVHLGSSHVRQGGNGVAIQGGESHLVEVDEAEVGTTRTSEGGCCMGADTAATDYNDEG